MKKLLNFNEARELLNTSSGHLRSLVFKKKIPFIKINRLIRFDYEELLNWIRSNSSKREDV